MLSALIETADHGKQEQRERHGHNGASYRHVYGTMLGDTHTHDRRVSDKGMRCIHRGHQHRCRQNVPQQPMVHRHSCCHRYEKREQTIDQCLCLLLPDILDVHFKRSEEHDIEQTNLAENLKRTVTLQQMQPMGTHNYSRRYHTDNGGYTQTFKEHWGEEYHAQHYKENPRRVSYGQYKMKHWSGFSAQNSVQRNKKNFTRST